MIRTVEHNGNKYPEFQTNGNAARFCRAFAQEVCVGNGFDVGCNRSEWLYRDKNGVDAMPIDPVLCAEYHATNMPNIKVDYIHSSHCLEHVPNWVEALDYWKTKLHDGGVLFLYLPDYSQTYWRPWHNRKHIHSFTPEIIRDYLTDNGWKNIFVSGVDLYNSFIAIAEK